MYGTDAGYVAYHAARGRTVETPPAGAGLVASEWLDGQYRDRFMGQKTGLAAQVREWPRTGAVDAYGYAVDSDMVPYQIEWATYEAMYQNITSPGSLQVNYSPNKYKRVVITGAVDVTYNDLDVTEIQQKFPIIAQVLASLLGGYGALSGLSGKVVRA